MATQFLCDQCHAVIDVESDTALIVAVHRRVDADEWADDDFVSGDARTFRYCSQAHLATHMERHPLPPVDLSETEDDGSVLGAIGCVLVALILLACTIYGAAAIVRDLL